MYDLMRGYKTYLEHECRYTEDAVVSYLGNLPIIFDKLEISHVSEIDAEKISRVWRYQRWRETADGIEISDFTRPCYLQALKQFLQYLEVNKFPVSEGVSNIINLPRPRALKVKSLSSPEQKQLYQFLLYNIGTDLKRRDTALTLLVWFTGCTLAEAASFEVHPEGRIKSGDNEVSGDFIFSGGAVFLKGKRFVSHSRRVKLPDAVVTFLNFYLENRPQRSRFLFVANSSRASKPLPVKSLEQALARTLSAARINSPDSQAHEVLRNSSFVVEGISVDAASPYATPAENPNPHLQNNFDSWTYTGNQHVA